MMQIVDQKIVHLEEKIPEIVGEVAETMSPTRVGRKTGKRNTLGVPPSPSPDKSEKKSKK